MLATHTPFRGRGVLAISATDESGNGKREISMTFQQFLRHKSKTITEET